MRYESPAMIVLALATGAYAQTTDFPSAIAQKHVEIQAAVKAGDLRKAYSLEIALANVIGEEAGRSAPSWQQLHSQGDAIAARAASDPNPNNRLYLLWLLPKTALQAGDFAKASYYASLLLESIGQAKKTGIYGDAVFEANTVQGRLAIRSGDLPQARRALLDSVSATDYSKYLSSSSGIRYDLAQELLDRGERDVVAQFLEKCAAFNPGDQRRYAVWIAAIKGGANPTLTSDRWY